MLIPTLRCSRIQAALDFYTRILDFEPTEPGAALTDPAFTTLRRGADLLFLSSQSGDGVVGQAVVVAVPDVAAVFRSFRARGLKTPGNPEAPAEIHEGPLVQSWGTREYYVKDPDGNTLRFVEGLVMPANEDDP